MVIGNGESRKSLNLDQFKKNHTIFGCNAIHRDMVVDHLICCDRRMAEEAVTNPQMSDTFIYVRDDWWRYYFKIRKNKKVKTLPELPYQGERKQDQPVHWGSGCYAILLAAELGHHPIHIIGFDLYATNSNQVNNIYKGTSNYAKQDSLPVDPGFWIYQISKIFIHYPNQQFYIVNDSDWSMPREWKLPNVSFENISQYTS